jgi:hypothetical protein
LFKIDKNECETNKKYLIKMNLLRCKQVFLLISKCNNNW